MNINTIWSLARAEMRSCRRLARTWVFIVAVFLVCTVWYIAMTEQTMSPHPPMGWINDQMGPRYTIATMMNAFVVIFSFGIIFLMFDVRARDTQNRIAEVVDTLPASNVELVLGRLIGVVVLLLIPCSIFLGIVAGYEVVTYWVDFRFRAGIQPISVVSQTLWSLIPNLVLFGAFVACLATLLRIRVFVALIGLGVLIGSFWLDSQIPIRLQESLSLFLGSTMFPSDLAPTIVTPTIVANKIAYLILALGLLLCAAGLLARTDPRRSLNIAAGGIAGGIAAVILVGLFAIANSTQHLKEQWTLAHKQPHTSSFPDVEHIEGTIVLHPGRTVSLDLTLSILTPTTNTTDFVVFSLNPGYRIQNLYIDDSEVSDVDFQSGLLRVKTQSLPAEAHEIRIVAKGRPDDRFAYLDQARDYRELKHPSVPRLGLKSSIFSRDFVVLMPGTVWYPISGTVLDRNNLETRPRDVFSTDLTVSVPKKWQVATTGRRIDIQNQKRSIYEFKSSTPIPELALIASRFEIIETTIGDIDFCVLFDRKHRENFDLFATVSDQIQEWTLERIRNAQAVSLDYPYETFYIVEVPSNLRIYGGGWNMESVLQPPGMMLLRETAFPTAQFEALSRTVSRWGWEEDEDDQQYLYTRLFRYFTNDEQGGSPFNGISRNFVSHQVSARHKGANVLQFLVDQLSNQLITEQESGSIMSASEFDTHIPIKYYGHTPEYQSSFNATTKMRIDLASLPYTWELLDQVALFDLDVDNESISAYHLLLVKGHALASSIIAYYGTDRVGAFLAQLLSKYSGSSFNFEEFKQTAATVGIEVRDWIVPWLTESSLPGFLYTRPDVTGLANSQIGETEYQTTFILHNAEETAGFARVLWSEEEGTVYRWAQGPLVHSDPIFLHGHQSTRVAIQSASPLTNLWVEPFLALNRVPIDLQVTTQSVNLDQKRATLPFVTDFDWRPPKTASIVVDDLDSSFSIVERDEDSGDYRPVLSDASPSDFPRELDRGLPLHTFPESGKWSRLIDPNSFGYYRRTYARIMQGDDTSAARFTARLPHSGSWSLEIYIPDTAFHETNIGISSDVFGFGAKTQLFRNRRADPDSPEEHYRIRVSDQKSKWTKEFDIANAEAGWNNVGNFELDSTEIDVFLSDWSGHQDVMVFADAIRWTPNFNDSESEEVSN